jgi:hypothetical protein
MKNSNKLIFAFALISASAYANVIDAGLNIASEQHRIVIDSRTGLPTRPSENVNDNRYTQDGSPSTYNYKMDH